MRTFLKSLLFLLAVSLSASTFVRGPVAHSPYYFSDNLEYVNAASATAVGFIDTSGVWAYATSPAPLEGSYSIRLQSSGNIIRTPTFSTGAAGGEAWVTFLWVPQVTTNDATFVLWSGVSVLVRSDGTIRISSGTNTSGATAHTDGTTYRVKIRYVPGSGSNARIEVRTYDTSGVSVSSLTKTDGTATNNMTYLEFKGSTSSAQLIDRIRVSSSDLGSLPP
jgi:hypothetical protein